MSVPSAAHLRPGHWLSSRPRGLGGRDSDIAGPELGAAPHGRSRGLGADQETRGDKTTSAMLQKRMSAI
eukprot:2953692-Pyramimonas_sp.AAC.1